MSIFGKIMGAIFGDKAAAATPNAEPSSPAGAQATTATTGATQQPVDVAPILDQAVAAKGQRLEWRTSIVDLMKALDIDSSLTARKELATELHYSGDMNDSATMNMWLHKQVLAKLAENGGKVPDELR